MGVFSSLLLLLLLTPFSAGVCVDLCVFKMSVNEKVLRVSQLDAVELDDELSNILQSQFLDVIYTLPTTLSLHRIKPELKAAVRFLIWSFSIESTGSTFGQRMLNLAYNGNSSLGLRHKIPLFLFSVLGNWISERLDDITPLISSQPREALRIAKIVSTTLKGLSLLNFVLFLLYGHYPSMRERLSGLTMTPTQPQTLRQLSYDYMNREILWYGFSEFIFFVLPQLNLFALKNWMRRKLGPWKDSKNEQTNFSECSFCEKTVTMPHITDCGHVYCYYCLCANCLADSRFPCAVCSNVILEYSAVRL